MQGAYSSAVWIDIVFSLASNYPGLARFFVWRKTVKEEFFALSILASCNSTHRVLFLLLIHDGMKRESSGSSKKHRKKANAGAYCTLGPTRNIV
jgi:hypothetical protein